jgi:hypothetical protein
MRHTRRALACLLAVLVLTELADVRAWAEMTAVWAPAHNLSNLPGDSTQATLALDPSTGGLFVAWVDAGVANRKEVVGRRWDGGSQTWEPGLGSPAENLSQSEWDDSGPHLFFDQQGDGLLLWTRRYSASQGAPTDGTDLLWRSWDGASWSDEAVLYHSDSYLPSSYGYGLIPVETPDSVLLFVTWDRNYLTTEYQNGGWTALSSWTALSVQLAQVIRDDNGVLHAAAYGDNSSQIGFDWAFQDGYYLSNDGTSWTTPVNLSSTDGVVRDLGLAFDAQGYLHFLWSDPDSSYSSESLKSAIWERVFDGNTWTPNVEVTVYNTDQAINGFSLATGIGGGLHLAWSEGILSGGLHTTLGIYYRQGDGSTWGQEETVFTSAPDSRYPLLVMDGDIPFLVWQEGSSPDREIYFSRQVALSSLYKTYLPLIDK